MLKKIFRTIYYVLLGGLTIIALLLVFSAFPIAGNYKTLMVLSGSMEPKIKTGSIVMVKGASTYKAGDVITFKGEGKTPTTHRIVDETEEGYVTRGDANNANDLKKLEPQNILGKVLLSIPYLGYLLAWVKTTPGLIIMIVIPAVIIIYSEALAIQKEIKKIIKQRREKETLEPAKISATTMPVPKTKKESVSPLPAKSSKAKIIKETAKKSLKASVIIFGFLSLLNLREIQGTRAFFMDEEKSSAEITAWVAETEPQKIVINEVYYDVSPACGTEADNEWVELYNPTNQNIDLQNWSLTDNNKETKIIATSKILPKYEFAVVSKVALTSCWTPPAGAVMIITGEKIGSGLNNDGDYLILKDAKGNEIDFVAWEKGYNNSHPAWDITASEGESIARKVKGVDTDSVDDWQVLTSPNPGTNPHSTIKTTIPEPPKLQTSNLNIAGDSTPTTTDTTVGDATDSTPNNNLPTNDSTPATENNIITDPCDSTPATDTIEGEAQEDIPLALEPNESQEDSDSAEDPSKTEDISPASSSDDSQADLAQEDPATDNAPSDTNEEDINNTDSSLSPPENPEPEISSPETSIEETPSSPADSSPLENLNNS